MDGSGGWLGECWGRLRVGRGSIRSEKCPQATEMDVTLPDQTHTLLDIEIERPLHYKV